MTRLMTIATALAVTTLVTSELSHSRTMGHYAPGVVGVRDLVVPPSPGFFYAQYSARYEADRYVDGDGNKIEALKKRAQRFVLNLRLI
ncbi:hypothetical protein N9Y37_05440 [Luminiphilus sp.]|nr:hypothetical protein [Luminiphilus sp.]